MSQIQLIKLQQIEKEIHPRNYVKQYKFVNFLAKELWNCAYCFTTCVNVNKHDSLDVKQLFSGKETHLGNQLIKKND